MEPSFLAELDSDDRRRILDAGVRRVFQPGEIVFREGDLAETLHLLRHGHAAVRITTRWGDVATLNILGPGDTFGELALIQPQLRRSASIAALDEVETLVLHRSVFEELRRTCPTVDRFLVLVLTERVRALSDQVRDAYYAPAAVRVLRQLQALCRIYDGATDGSADTQPTETVVPVTQEVLASMAGTTRSTVNRALQDAAADGFVRLTRGKVVVVDPVGLGQRARV